MDDEMIDRCTLAAHNFNVANNPKIDFETMPASYKNTWRRLAIAVIRAMREPTAKMIYAVDHHPDYMGYGDDSLEWLYSTMIDSITND